MKSGPWTLEFVQTVQRSDLVGFSQCRVVENRIAKVFDGCTERESNLTDVHNFGSTIADQVYPKQTQRFRIKEQFQEALIIAEYLSLGQLDVACYSNLIRNFVTSQLFFCVSDHRDFRDRINPIGDKHGRDGGGLTKHVTARQTSLLHRGAGQSRKSNHITSSIDVRDRSLEVFIHRQFPAPIALKSGGREVELIAVGLAANGIQQCLSVDVLAAFQFGKHTIARFVETDGNHALPKPEYRPELPQLKAERLDNFPILEIQQQRTLIQQRDLHAQRGEHGSIFQSDDSRADDDQVSRHFFQAVNLVRVNDALAVNRNLRRVRRTCATSYQYVSRANQVRSLFSPDFDLMGTGKTRVAFYHSDVVAAEL